MTTKLFLSGVAGVLIGTALVAGIVVIHQQLPEEITRYEMTEPVGYAPDPTDPTTEASPAASINATAE
jgi:hypothetical protein